MRPLDLIHAKTLPSTSPLQLMRKHQISHLSKDWRGKHASMDEKCTLKSHKMFMFTKNEIGLPLRKMKMDFWKEMNLVVLTHGT